MSVVHEMLKDLQDTELGALPADPAQPVIDESGPGTRLLKGALLITLPLLLLLAFWQWQNRSDDVSTPLAARLPKSEPHLPKSEQGTVAPSPTECHSVRSEAQTRNRLEETKPCPETRQAIPDNRVAISGMPPSPNSASDAPRAVQLSPIAETRAETPAAIQPPPVAPTPTPPGITAAKSVEPTTSIRITPHQPRLQERIDVLLQRAQRSLAQRNEADAEAALHEVVQLAPDNEKYRNDWLRLLSHTDPAQAENEIDAALGARHSDWTLRELRAGLYQQAQQYHAIIALLQPDLPALEEYPDYYTLLALAYAQTDQHSAAYQLYSALHAAFPSVGNHAAGAGIAADQLQDFSTALRWYTRALQDRFLPQALRDYAEQRRSQLMQATP